LSQSLGAQMLQYLMLLVYERTCLIKKLACSSLSLEDVTEVSSWAGVLASPGFEPRCQDAVI